MDIDEPGVDRLKIDVKLARLWLEMFPGRLAHGPIHREAYARSRSRTSQEPPRAWIRRLRIADDQMRIAKELLDLVS